MAKMSQIENSPSITEKNARENTRSGGDMRARATTTTPTSVSSVRNIKKTADPLETANSCAGPDDRAPTSAKSADPATLNATNAGSARTMPPSPETSSSPTVAPLEIATRASPQFGQYTAPAGTIVPHLEQLSGVSIGTPRRSAIARHMVESAWQASRQR